MQRKNGDMIILSSLHVSLESSASTTYFRYYIHLPVCQLPVCVYWVRDLNYKGANQPIFLHQDFATSSQISNVTLLHVGSYDFLKSEIQYEITVTQ